MKSVTYERYRGSLLDALNLQALLDKLSNFLLDSGFAGSHKWRPFEDPSGEAGEPDSLDALRQAILQHLLESGQLTPRMMEALRGEGHPAPEAMDAIARLLDEIVERLAEEGYLRVGPEKVAGEKAQLQGGREGDSGRAVARSVKFSLTEKGLDFLSYRALRDLLGSRGKASAGMHETQQLATGVEAEGAPKPYEFGDTLNLDVPATLLNAITREGIGIPLAVDYGDLRIHQSVHRSSCATVLLLDCSHSMVLYGEDRFTPAKKVALALSHLLRTRFPGDVLRCALFHDAAEEIPLHSLARAQVGPYHTNTAEGLRIARRILQGERKEMRQIVMITDGKPSAMTLPDGRIYKNSMGLDRKIIREAYHEVAACRKMGISINTFMLARDPALVAFVRQVTEISRGKAYFTSTLTLGQYILLDYMNRKTRHIH